MFKKCFYILLWLCVLSNPAYAEKLTIACAANFTAAMKELVSIYEEETGVRPECTFGSTGMLFGQIRNGAPYALFFAADEIRPYMLHDEGVALVPTLYAKGKVVLWSGKPCDPTLKDWKDAAACVDFIRLGIASPQTAPYGARAQAALASAHLLGKVESKLAYGKSVGMAFQYAYSGAADASFIAMSQALSDKGAEGHFWEIPEAGLVNQAACVINREDNGPAIAFLAWLTSADARAVIRKYGYE